MISRIKPTHAIFGFGDTETGERLRAFFLKHTGKDIDFNNIKHYRSGFTLLLFTLPLNEVQQIGITAASHAPSSYKRFDNLNDFIAWYENSPFVKRLTVEQIMRISTIQFADPKVESERLFVKQFDVLGINIEARFDPFPFLRYCEAFKAPAKDEIMVTTVLYNGVTVRVPFKDSRKILLIMNTNIFYASKSENWTGFLYRLGIRDIDKDKNITRFTPTDDFVVYAEKYDEDVQIIMSYYNALLNKDHPFEYPNNWFDVAKKVMKYHGGPVGIPGTYLAAYMFAAPRNYLKYFSSKKSTKQIAEDIYYDN